MRAVSLLLAALGVLVLAAGAASSPAGTDPKTMVLQPADLSAGFKQTRRRYVSNAVANRESAVKKDLAKLGRLRGYEAIYEKEEIDGIFNLISRAAKYKTAAGAHESMAASIQGAEASREPPFRRLTVGKIGNEARLYKATLTEDGFKFHLFSIIWRSDTVYAALIATGLAGEVKPGDVVALARKQQARIAAG